MTNDQFSVSAGGQSFRPSSIVLRQLVSSLPVVTLLILALLAAAPLWGPGIVNTRAGGDSPFLLWRTHQMAANLRAGVFPVRWMPDAAYGYGYPFFSYYAALPFYLAGLLHVVGLDILTAIKLTQTLGFIAAAFAMYGWMRRHLSQAGTWLAAVAYTFAAFHLVNVYTRGDSLSEFCAFVFFPLILWAVDGAFEQRNARSVVALALAYGGLVATHNVSALIFSPFALLYVIVRAAGLRAPRPTLDALRSTFCALGLGLALSAWFWVPALGETSYGQLGEQTTGYFNYSNHFRGLDIVQPTLAFDYKVGQTTPFATSSAQAALAVIGVIAIVVKAIRRRKLEALPAFTLIGLVISTVMITPFSRPVWEHVPFLPLVQFPWRFLTVQAVFTALATAQVADRKMQETQDARRNTQYACMALGLLLAITALVNLRPARLLIGPADVTTERLQLYEMFTANVGTTIRYEYLPRQVVPRLYTSDALIEPDQPMRAAALEGEATASRLATAPTKQTWRVMSSPGATIAFPILWWPGWQATVDGQPTPIRPANSSGRITLDLASGEHTVILSLGRTPLRAVAEGVSLVALIAVLVIWLRPMLKHRAKRAQGDELHSTRWFTIGLTALVLLISLLVFSAQSMPATTANDETMDFVSQPYLHHNPNGVELSPGLRLMTYDLSADELQAGQTLNVNLDWINADRPSAVTVKLTSPAQHLVGLESAPMLAESSAVIGGNLTARTTHALPIPPDAPRGVYLIKVLAGAEPVYLRPVRVRSETPVGDAPVLAQFGDRIRLHRVRAEQVTPTQLAVTLDWSAARPVEANYAVAVRLSGVASIDTQPGYGFVPTSLWRPGELISDRYTLKLPEGTPPRDDYKIQVILYDAATLAGIGQYLQENIALTLYSRRPVDSTSLARLGSELSLAMLDVPATHQQGAPTLTLNAGWLATSAQSADRIARWTIYDSANAPVFAQTFDLVAGTPSSLWPAGAFVVGQTRLSVPAALAPGRYRLGVTALNLLTQSEEGSYLAPSMFEIVGHPRSFAVPPMQHRSDVEFGKQIRLLGYDLKSPVGKSSQQQVALTLYWQAMVAPQGDYKVFAHLFDPTNEKIAAQHDALPLDGHYPTSWWAAGEVVSETVTLDLTGVKPGAYRLAVGLYDANTMTRLAALGPNGVRLDADRIVLPESIPGPP